MAAAMRNARYFDVDRTGAILPWELGTGNCAAWGAAGRGAHESGPPSGGPLAFESARLDSRWPSPVYWRIPGSAADTGALVVPHDVVGGVPELAHGIAVLTPPDADGPVWRWNDPMVPARIGAARTAIVWSTARAGTYETSADHAYLLHFRELA